MKTTKRFYKKPLFWIIIILALLATPSAIKIFELYIYSPQTEPAPEDFYIREEEPPWDPQTLPKEDVEIKKSEDGSRVLVYHYKDGYKLDLPSDLSASTWELQPDQVSIFNQDGSCAAYTYRIDGEKTVQESFENSEEEYQTESHKLAYNVLRHELERIENAHIESFIEHYDEEMFGYQPSILIQGDGAVFGISQKGNERYPECDLMMRVLKGFSLLNEQS